ncbi:MAG: Gfo/Idh/MocA family oxidoreductase [Tagaea sp.]|nr:Gfo/Idh/MocA family oxidoreductase [Tagaea sp.]
MIRVALAGTGSIAAYHLDALAAIPEARVTHVVGRDRAKAQALAASAKVPEGTDDLDAALAGADAIVIATPDDTHEALCARAIAARKAILVQKPMAQDAASGRRILAMAEAAGIDLQVSFMHRYFEEFVAARALLEAGAIGTPLSARMRNATPGPDWADWFFKRSRVSGGVVPQLGVHGIDLLTRMFGPIAETHATTAILRPERRLADGRVVAVENPDGAWATYRFASGIVAAHDMSMIEAAGTDRYRLELYGTEGAMVLRGDSAPLRILRKGGAGWETPALPGAAPGVRHHRRWLDGIRGHAPRETTARDALHGLLVAEAIARSAERQGAVERVEPL